MRRLHDAGCFAIHREERKGIQRHSRWSKPKRRRALRWQRLKPFEKFAESIERHWDGITAYCQPENKAALGFVEGLSRYHSAGRRD